MDSSRLRALLILIPILGGLLWWYSRDEKIWAPSYRPEGKQPYDLGTFKKLLKLSVGEDNFIEWNRGLDQISDSLEPANIFFVNPGFYGDSLQRVTALKLAKAGHHLFFCTNTDPNIDQWHEPPFVYSRTLLADSLTAVVVEDQWEKTVIFRGRKETMSVRLLGYDPDDTSYVHVLGKLIIPKQGLPSSSDTMVNWVRVDLGEGAIHYLSTPILLSNYELRDSAGFAYAQKIVGAFPKRKILWDNYNLVSRENVGANNVGDELAVIREEPALRSAWLALMALGLLFLLFGARRISRPIPLLSTPDNRSIGFARRLGLLYLRSNKPRYLAEEMMRLFDNHNHRKYGLIREIKERDKAVAELERRSGVSRQLLQRIFQREWELRFNPASEAKELLPLFTDLQQFYSQAR